LYGDRARIGFIIPTNNTILEAECAHYLPDGVSAHFSRISTDRTFSVDEARNIESRHIHAVEQLEGAFVDLIAYACMASAIAVKPDWSEEFVLKVEEKTGLPAVAVSAATAEALRSLGANRIAIGVTYPESMNPILNAYCAHHGFEAVRIVNMQVTDKREICRLPVSSIIELGRQADCSDADAIALLATDIRALPASAQLEAELGKPVVTSNGALLWAALGAAGIADSIPGAGHLLESVARSPAHPAGK
jgi:maleate cis-trans isomerase